MVCAEGGTSYTSEPQPCALSILTRQRLLDGSLRQVLPMPAHLMWSEAQLELSLAETLARQPGGAGAPIWVFAYGSLIWNPLIATEVDHNATLTGWRRSFCMCTVAGRGCPEQPGRMLSLQPGGATHGVALRLPQAQAAHELTLLWRREMGMGSYRPTWVDVALEGGGSAQAIAFVANPTHPSHEPDDSVHTVARRIAVACGAFGPNVDYLTSLHAALHARGLRDDYVEAVMEAVRSLSPPDAAAQGSTPDITG